MPVSEVMTPEVVTVEPDVSAREAAQTIRERDIGSLVVVEGGEPVGLVTDKVLLGLLVGGDAEEAVVEDVMITPVVTVEDDASIEAAAERLRDNRIKRLPVTRNGGLAGIVTVTDLSYFLPTASMRDIRNRVEWGYEHAGLEDREVDVGDVVRFSKTLSDDDVQRFAEASGDLNELHVSEEYAANTRFGRRIVHGVLVLGVVSAALSRLPGVAIYLSQNASFQAPVEVGDRVEAECTARQYLGNNRYSFSTDVYSGDERVVQGEATVLIDPESSPQEQP